jgi:hypothetical protein
MCNSRRAGTQYQVSAGFICRHYRPNAAAERDRPV